MVKLRDCPFCAGIDIVATSNGMHHFSMLCNGCGAEGPVQETQDIAAQAWNRRAPPKGLPDRLPGSVQTRQISSGYQP